MVVEHSAEFIEQIFLECKAQENLDISAELDTHVQVEDVIYLHVAKHCDVYIIQVSVYSCALFG